MLDKAKHNVKHNVKLNVKLNVMTLGHSTVIDGDYLPRATEEDHDAATTAVKVNAAIPVRVHEGVIGSPTVAVRGHIAGAGLLASCGTARPHHGEHCPHTTFSAGTIYRRGRGVRSTWRQ